MSSNVHLDKLTELASLQIPLAQEVRSRYKESKRKLTELADTLHDKMGTTRDNAKNIIGCITRGNYLQVKATPERLRNFAIVLDEFDISPRNRSILKLARYYQGAFIYPPTNMHASLD